MDKRTLERLIPTLAHLLVLIASLHFLISMMYYRQMPRTSLLLTLPNVILLIWQWRRSPYIRDHVAQALGWQAMMILLGLLPWVSRLPALLSEDWLKPGVIGTVAAGLTPDFSLLVILVIMLGFAFPAAAVDAIFHAYARKIHQYPIISRLLPRPTFPDSDYIWHS